MNSSYPATRPRYVFLDSLRGLAAVAVMAFHFGGFLATDGRQIWQPVTAVTKYGWLGVQVFFVLSGFVVTATLPPASATTRAFAPFLARRFIRLVPPYWVSVLLVVALRLITFAVGRGEGQPPVTVGMLIAHATFTQYMLNVPSLQDVYWTLALEVQFYLLLTVVGVANRARAGVGWGVFAVLTVVSIAALLGGYRSNVWFIGHWHCFAVGVVSFKAVTTPTRWAEIAFGFIVALAALSVWLGRPEVGVAAATAVALCFAGWRDGLKRWLNYRPLRWLGGISYSLYVTHAVVGVVVCRTVFKRLGDSPGTVLLGVLAATGCSLVFAAILRRRVESPAIQWSHRYRPSS